MIVTDFEGIEYHGPLSDSSGEIATKILAIVCDVAESGTEVDSKLYRSIFEFRETVRFSASAEQSRIAFLRIMNGDYVTYALSKYNFIVSQMIPEITPMFNCEQQAPYHPYNVWHHTLSALANTPQDEVTRLIVFFHDIGKPDSKTCDIDGSVHFRGHEDVSATMTNAIMRRLGFENEMTERVVKMVKHHKLHPNPTKRSVKKLLQTIGTENFNTFCDVRTADKMGQSHILLHERLRNITKIKEVHRQLRKDEERFKISDLEITGNDLLKLGVPEGYLLGAILRQLRDSVSRRHIYNDYHSLIQEASFLIEITKW